jgi:hypothetical protein
VLAQRCATVNVEDYFIAAVVIKVQHKSSAKAQSEPRKLALQQQDSRYLQRWVAFEDQERVVSLALEVVDPTVASASEAAVALPPPRPMTPSPPPPPPLPPATGTRASVTTLPSSDGTSTTEHNDGEHRQKIIPKSTSHEIWSSFSSNRARFPAAADRDSV